MNRPGHPPQRPPNLTAQGLGAPYRGPFPSSAPGAPFALPSRAAFQQGAFPGLPSNHRTAAQSMVMPSPNFMQQPPRAQASFLGSFGTGVQSAAVAAAAAQQQQHSQSHPPSQSSLALNQPQLPQPHSVQQQQQPQQSQARTQPSNVPPPHLQASNMTSQQSNVSTSDGGALDPNDFPALGSGTANPNPGGVNSPVATLVSSYASQAGTGVSPGSVAGGQQSSSTAGSSQQRDFTPDDFPALGGQSSSSQQPQQPQQSQQSLQPQHPSIQAQQHQDAGHPPGLNGLESRQSLPPGVLNLTGQRSITSQDAERRSASKLATWNGATTLVVTSVSTQQQNGSLQHNQLLSAPPRMSPPFQQQQQQPPLQQTQPQVPPPPFSTGEGTLASGGVQIAAAPAAPQTPAQQVLMSAADRWGLLGLLASIKNADADQNLLSIGTDLGTMGLDMQNQGNLFSSFITPWSDSSAAHTVEPDFHLPPCYSVNAPPPGPNKAQAFSEETLFYMFYAHPRDALQEVAAQELYTRNWRYNKELRLWLTKETGRMRQSKSIENGHGEQGLFTYWDLDLWEKGLKEITVMYADLESKDAPAFVGQLLQPTAQGQQHLHQGQLQAQTQASLQQQPGATVAAQQQTQAQAQTQASRGVFPGLSVAAAM